MKSIETCAPNQSAVNIRINGKIQLFSLLIKSRTVVLSPIGSLQSDSTQFPSTRVLCKCPGNHTWQQTSIMGDVNKSPATTSSYTCKPVSPFPAWIERSWHWLAAIAINSFPVETMPFKGKLRSHHHRHLFCLPLLFVPTRQRVYYWKSDPNSRRRAPLFRISLSRRLPAIKIQTGETYRWGFRCQFTSAKYNFFFEIIR